jgi:hypothetical protein
VFHSEGIIMATVRIRPAVRVRVDQVVGQGPLCPAQLEQLRRPPADRDDAVAVMRWQVAWLLVEKSVATIARESRVPATAIVSFIRSPARVAGAALTLGQAARLMRLLEVTIEDRELVDDFHEHRRIAQPYVEVAGIDFARALRRARQVRRAYRAANPGASTLGLD